MLDLATNTPGASGAEKRWQWRACACCPPSWHVCTSDAVTVHGAPALNRWRVAEAPLPAKSQGRMLCVDRSTASTKHRPVSSGQPLRATGPRTGGRPSQKMAGTNPTTGRLRIFQTWPSSVLSSLRGCSGSHQWTLVA